MIPNLKLILYGIAAASLLSLGIYARHIYNKAERVDAAEALVAKLEAEGKRKDEQTQQALERERDIGKKLEAANRGNADLLRRVQRAYALSKTPSRTPEPDGAPGAGVSPGSTELDSAIQRIIGACKRDSIRLGEFQRYYESAPAELK